MSFIKLSASERRRFSAFFTCLILAALFWVFITLSGPVKFGVKLVLHYKNAPEKRAFHPLQPDTVTGMLQGTGWQMLLQKMNAPAKSVDVDLQSLENKDFIVLSSQLRQINDRKDFEQQITAFSPDTLYFDFSNRAVKKVPVHLLTAIAYQHQFAQSGNMLMDPASVTVSGPGEAIARIHYWNTDSLRLDSISEPIRTSVNLQPAPAANINVYPKSIGVRVPVDEFTEKRVEVPVRLVNNRHLYHVKIFPEKVTITFTTSLSRYPELNENFFEAEADLDLWEQRNYSTLPVRLTRVPAYCKIVSIQPRNIDFIIRK